MVGDIGHAELVVDELISYYWLIAAEAIAKESPTIKSYIHTQLLHGIKGDGSSLGSYLNDPYFKGNGGRAKAYMNYKAAVYNEQYTWYANSEIKDLLRSKSKDTINLIISGTFYNSILVRPMGQGKDTSINITSTWAKGAKIERQYGSLIFQLAPNIKDFLLATKIEPYMLERYKDIYNGL